MTCLKVPYASRSDARRAMSRIGMNLGGLRPYRCKHCAHWHLSIKSRREVKQSKKLGRNVKPHPEAEGLVDRPVDDAGVG